MLGKPHREGCKLLSETRNPSLKELLVAPQSEERLGDNEGKGMAWEGCYRSRLARAKAL